MTLFHKNVNNEKPYVTIILHKDLWLHLYKQDLNIIKVYQITSFITKNCSFVANGSKFIIRQLFFCYFLKMKKVDFRLFYSYVTSCLMLRAKGFASSARNKLTQNRLHLYNINELHTKLTVEHPNIKIYWSTFPTLLPLLEVTPSVYMCLSPECQIDVRRLQVSNRSTFHDRGNSLQLQ